jgi:hypothetical protein
LANGGRADSAATRCSLIRHGVPKHTGVSDLVWHIIHPHWLYQIRGIIISKSRNHGAFSAPFVSIVSVISRPAAKTHIGKSGDIKSYQFDQKLR